MDESDKKEKKIREDAIFTPYIKIESTPEQAAKREKNFEILKKIRSRRLAPANTPTTFPHTLSFGNSITDRNGKYEVYGRAPQEIMTKTGEILSFPYLVKYPEYAARHELYCEFDEKKIGDGNFEQTTKITMLTKAALPLSVKFLFENRCDSSCGSETYIIHYKLTQDGRIDETKKYLWEP